LNPEHHLSGFAPVYKGQLYYEVAGSGHPILFIHAGIADCSMWDEPFAFFSHNFRVIRYDTRGFGKSRTETTEFSNQQDIIDLFAHLGVNKATIIGISRGGQIAIDFTIEHPEFSSALIPVAAGVSGFVYQPGDNEKARREYEVFIHMDELWESKSFDELAELEAHVWADGPSQPVGRASIWIRDYIHNMVKANYARQDGIATARPLNPPAVDRLGQIRLPTLILVGEYDTSGTLAMADKLEKDILGARKISFPDSAHMLPMEHPHRFNELVLNFLEKEVLHDSFSPPNP
jgi:3-oxoadipate enol-lactonase